MSIPSGAVEVPARVRELARGASLEAVWMNALGGLTFRADDADGSSRFVKWGSLDAEVSMAAEADRLAWALPHTPVPAVLEHGCDTTHEWLVTRALTGRSAVDPRWIADPATAVRAVGRGLRALHDALPLADCPFDWGVPARIENARRRGVVVPPALHEPPPIDRLVVCHGDACVPNTLVDDGGAWVGHVDLGALGVADRWADLAVAAMSTEWNYGPGWADALVAAYGVEADPGRAAYYRDLWNAT